MTPAELRAIAVRRVEAAAGRTGAACCRASLLAAAAEVGRLEVPSPEEGVRARSRVILALETCARLLRRGHDGRAVAGQLGGVIQQIRRLIVVGVTPFGRQPETVPPTEEQPERDAETTPEPAVVRARAGLQAEMPPQEGFGHHGHGPEDGDQESTTTARGVPEQPRGDVLVEREGDGEEEAQGEQTGSRGHRPYAAPGRVVVIPDGAPRARRGGSR
ncbi:hypothetical protein [Sorangium sp. So ce388]|uniref:hypothetical protein n=1 Tax=Sorangium sp. So ce388 TaxID=3133309 RepID=UPI003F5B6B49